MFVASHTSMFFRKIFQNLRAISFPLMNCTGTCPDYALSHRTYQTFSTDYISKIFIVIGFYKLKCKESAGGYELPLDISKDYSSGKSKNIAYF